MKNGNGGWTISRDDLIERLDILEKVPMMQGAPSSSFYQIENLGNGRTRWMLSSTAVGWVIIQGQGEWPHPKILNLDRRMMIPFVMAAKALNAKASFVFGFQGKHLTVRQGRRKAVFFGNAKVEGYGGKSHGVLTDKMALSEEVKNLIHCARDCGTVDPAHPQYGCVYVNPYKDKLEIMASDEGLVYRALAKTKNPLSEPVPLPLLLVPLLDSRNLKAIEWKQKVVALRFEGGEIWSPVSAKARNGFPAARVREVAAEGERQKILFSVSSRKLAGVLQRLGMYLQSVKREDWVLEISGVKGQPEVKFETKVTTSWFRETLRVDYKATENGLDTFQINWPINKVLSVFDFLARMNKEMPLEVRYWKASKNKLGERHLATYVKSGAVQLLMVSKPGAR